jgi:hypothetical protein
MAEFHDATKERRNWSMRAALANSADAWPVHADGMLVSRLPIAFGLCYFCGAGFECRCCRLRFMSGLL